MSKPRVYATRRAVKDARGLGVLPGVGELTPDEAANLLAFWVRGLIVDGSLARDRDAPDGRLIALGEGWKARVRKQRNLLGRYWSVLAVEAHDGGRIAPRPKMPPKHSGRDTRAQGAADAAFAGTLEEHIEDLLRRSGPWT